jgi:hypothetical protein
VTGAHPGARHVAAPEGSLDRWCQRWRHRRQAWQHQDGPGFDPGRFTVEPITKAAAQRFVLEHHYSAAWPAAKLCFGLIDHTPHLDDYPAPHPSALTARGRIVGVAVLSVPTHQAVLTNPFPGLRPNHESMDLGRFSLLDPVAANAESWFLARVFRAIRSLGVLGVVAFADPVPRLRGGELIMPGHVGWAYQGSNGVYLGRTRPSRDIVLPDGTSLPGRAASKVTGGESGRGGVTARLTSYGAPPPRPGEPPAAWLTRAAAAIGAVTTRHPGKHKYAWQLGRSRDARLALPGRDYPKAPDLTALTTGGTR